MPTSPSFNEKVAARTRAAEQILNTPDLKARFLDFGGLEEDLERIIQTGQAAEALNHAQGDAKSTGKAATIDVLQHFEQLQGEYSIILGIARAVLGDLKAAGVSKTTTQRLEDIIRNEAQVTVTIEDQADGTKKARRSRKVSQEALRAEIEKDATALAAFTEIASEMSRRRCDRARLEDLQRQARGLSGKLGDRVVKKGAAKGATSQENEMVLAQRLKWGSVYRLLLALGNQDARVRLLLKDAGKRD